MNGVDAAFLLQIRGNHSCVLHGDAALALVPGIDTAENGQVAASFLADVLDNQPGQTHTVFKAAAELVGALVGAGGNKGADQIAMGAVDFHHIHAGSLCPGSGVAVALNQTVDFFRRHCLGNFAAAVRCHGAGCFQGETGEFGVALGTGMLQLNGDLCAVAMAAVNGALKAVHSVIGEQAGFPGAALCLGVHHGGLDGNQAEPALCPSLIVGCGTVAEGAVGICKVVAHGRHNETVRNGNGANLNGRKHGRIFHYIQPLSILRRSYIFDFLFSDFHLLFPWVWSAAGAADTRRKSILIGRGVAN